MAVLKSKRTWLIALVAVLVVGVGVAVWSVTAQAAQRERVAAWDAAAEELAATLTEAETVAGDARLVLADAVLAEWEDAAVDDLEGSLDALDAEVTAVEGEFAWLVGIGSTPQSGAQSGSQSGTQSGAVLGGAWTVEEVDAQEKIPESTDAMLAATTGLTQKVATVADQTALVESGVNDLILSNAQTAYEAAVKAADEGVAAAQALLKESDGKVANEAVRVALSDAVANVSTLLKDEVKVSELDEVDGIKEATTALVDATVALGKQAAATAADMATKAGAEAAAVSTGSSTSGTSSRSSSGGSYSASGSSGSSGSSGGSSSWSSGASSGGGSVSTTPSKPSTPTAPSKPTTPTTPTAPSKPTTPPSGGGGGGDYWFPGGTLCTSSDGSTWEPDANGNC